MCKLLFLYELEDRICGFNYYIYLGNLFYWFANGQTKTEKQKKKLEQQFPRKAYRSCLKSQKKLAYETSS